MPGHRRRRCPNINPAYAQDLVFDGVLSAVCAVQDVRGGHWGASRTNWSGHRSTWRPDPL